LDVGAEDDDEEDDEEEEEDDDLWHALLTHRQLIGTITPFVHV